MSDPLTLATIALTAANTVGQANAARTEGDEAAAIGAQQAQTARQTAARNVADLRRRNAALLASQRVRYSKGGIVLSGTPLDLLADAAAETELAVQDALYEGDARAARHLLSAEAARRRGRTAQQQGLLSAGTRLLGDAGPLLRTRGK
jgi:hypothetical protein